MLRALACLLLATASIGAHAQSANLVGFWWKPSESGWGVSIQQQGARTFAVWFTYDAQAKPVWYTLDGSYPRRPGVSVSTGAELVLVPEAAAKRAFVPAADIGSAWRSDGARLLLALADALGC